MDILIFLVGIDQFSVTAHMREDPQFDLGVVRISEQHSIRGNECLTDLLAHLRLHGNVLKIGICRADPSRRCYRLIKACVDPAVLCHVGRKAVSIGRFEFGNRPVLQYIVYDRIIGGKLLEDSRSCGITRFCLLAAGHSHLLKENNTELFGGSDIAL